MSEKHLTEASWKALTLKSQVKDNVLHKALQAYSKACAEKDSAQTLGALEEIGTHAVKLKKANPALKELTTYLDEVIKETNKAKSALTTLAQSHETEAKGRGEKGDPEETDLKGRLLSALKKVKAGDGQVSLGFVVCVAKPCYGILLARSPSEKIGPLHKKELAKLTQGTKFIEGKCVFEKDAHTFVVETVPPGLAKNLKHSLKEHTGLLYKVRVRDVEGKIIADGDTEVVPEETATVAEQIPAAPPAAPSVPGGEEMARFTARFKALQPDIVKAIATKSPQGDEIKRLAVEAGSMANKKDFARATQVLNRVETLIGKVVGTAGRTVPSPSSPADGAFQQAWRAASSNLLDAVDTIREQLAGFANALMASGEENLIWIAEEGVTQVFAPLRDAALTIDRASSKLPARVVFKARPAIETLKRQMVSPRVLACDQNKLGVTVTIRATISKAIHELEAALELAKA